MAEQIRCECLKRRRLTHWDEWIRFAEDEPAPQPHEPGQCPGTYGLQQFERDGKLVWLCSWCW